MKWLRVIRLLRYSCLCPFFSAIPRLGDLAVESPYRTFSESLTPRPSPPPRLGGIGSGERTGPGLNPAPTPPCTWLRRRSDVMGLPSSPRSLGMLASSYRHQSILQLLQLAVAAGLQISPGWIHTGQRLSGGMRGARIYSRYLPQFAACSSRPLDSAAVDLLAGKIYT